MNHTLLFSSFFIGTLVVSFFVSRLVKYLANHLELHDYPDGERKIHYLPIPKSGGLAIYLSFVLAVVVLGVTGLLGEVSLLKVAGIIIGGTVMVLGGLLDDKYDLKPVWQFLFPFLGVLLVVLAGTHVSYITSPLGTPIVLDQYKILTYPLFGSLLVFLWILGMTYTTKFLDGMDGLVTGISGIAGLVIFGLSLRPSVGQTSTALLALVFAAACFGFLRWNWYPAKIFLGEGGSTFTGFVIGCLAVISGGKIATAFLVLGIPILDAAWVIARRLWFGSSPFVGDKRHLHFRLLDIGFSQRQAVLFLYFLAAAFGAVAVFLQSLGKLVALGILIAVMIGVAIGVVIQYKRKVAHEERNEFD